MSNGTLTQKLFGRVAPTILATIVIIGGLAFYSTRHEINNVYDAQLINNANILWALVKNEFQESAEKTNKEKEVDDIDFTIDNQLSFNKDADDYADERMFRIWNADDIIMFSSTALPKNIGRQPLGFSDVTYKGEKWRVYALLLPNTPISIEVGEKQLLRDNLVRNILADLFLPLLVLIPLVGILLLFGIKNGLDTISLLVQQIRNRSPNDLTPMGLESLPRDIVPLGKSINQLFTKLNHSINAERRFADHAAHQLRTPLAGLKLQIQMLAKADSEQERKQIINDLMTTNDRASQLISKLLISARISHQPVNLQPVFLYKSVATIIADLGMLATEKNLDISLEGDESACVNADETLLNLMVGNLIENAIKFTPPSGRIQVSIGSQDDMWCLSICDNGPGIAEDQRDLVFQRFYRADIPHVEGSGLGLSIVSDIAERFLGNVILKTPDSGHGLLVEVLLPKAEKR